MSKIVSHVSRSYREKHIKWIVGNNFFNNKIEFIY